MEEQPIMPTLEDLENIDDRTDITELLHKSARKSLTREEIRAQKVSFAMGMLPHDSPVTRKQVKDMVYSRYG